MLVKFIFVFHAADNFFNSFRDFIDKLLLMLNHSLLLINAVDNRLQLGNFGITFSPCRRKFIFAYIPRHINVNQFCTLIFDSCNLGFQFGGICACRIHSNYRINNGNQIVSDFLFVVFKALGNKIHNVGGIFIANTQPRTAHLVSCLINMGTAVFGCFITTPRLITASVLTGLISRHIA